MEKTLTQSSDLVLETYKQNADTSIAKTGLYADSFNDWLGLMIYARAERQEEDKINAFRRGHPIPKYEEKYGKKLDDNGKVNEAWTALNLYIRNGSNPEKVREYDELVDTVNADTERIIAEHDVETAKKYYSQMFKLLYGREP